MLSFDTNILFHSLNADSPRHESAYNWLSSLQRSEDVAVSEFILSELYVLLRNPVVSKAPLTSREAVEIIQAYRQHPKWRLIGFPQESRELHDQLWDHEKGKSFAFRKVYDVRTALSLRAHGVSEFATVNLKDFQGMGFERVWNPLN